MESVRISWSTVKSYLCQLIIQRTSFEAKMSLAQMDHWRTVWSWLDVEVETIDVLAEQIQLRFDGGRLKVHTAVAESGDWITTLESCLHAAWKLTKWTESRWMCFFPRHGNCLDDRPRRSGAVHERLRLQALALPQWLREDPRRCQKLARRVRDH